MPPVGLICPLLWYLETREGNITKVGCLEALDQLLTQLDCLLNILSQKDLKTTAVVKKSALAELLQLHIKISYPDKQYIYMNKVTVKQ